MKHGYGAVGLGYAVAFCLAAFLPRNAQAFVVSSAVVASRGSYPAAKFRGGGGNARARSVRARTGRGLGVAAGGNAVESANTLSTDDGDGMRVARIQGFTDKVSGEINYRCNMFRVRGCGERTFFYTN